MKNQELNNLVQPPPPEGIKLTDYKCSCGHYATLEDCVTCLQAEANKQLKPYLDEIKRLNLCLELSHLQVDAEVKHSSAAVKKAREDTAREIFEQEEEGCPHDHRVFANRPKSACEICHDELKARYLEGGK